MRRELVRVLADAADTTGLRALQAAIAEHADAAAAALAAAVTEPGSGRSRAEGTNTDRLTEKLADVVSAQVRVFAGLLQTADADARPEIGRDLAQAVAGRPMTAGAVLAGAELLAAAGDDAAAAGLLARLGFDNALTVSALSYSGEDRAVERRFRYWRLQHVLSARSGTTVPPSVPPDPATPAGNHIDPAAFTHTDTAAIALAPRIDSSVRRLAEIDAKSRTDDPVPLHEAWSQLVPMFEPFRSRDDGRQSSTHLGMEQQRLPVLTTAVGVAVRHSPELLRLTAEHLASRISADPAGWPPDIRAPLGRGLRDAGVQADWYGPTLEEQVADADVQDVYGRLEALASLIHVYAADGRVDTARKLALGLPVAAFGVGYRKDYQFDTWVDWLSRALAGPDGHRFVPDAAWLARLLVVAATRTEGAPAKAAAALPAAVVPADPAAAVLLFEFLVAHGTVSHPDALALLVAKLLECAKDPASPRLAAGLIVDVLAPSTSVSHPEAATALAAAARRLLPAAEATTVVKAAAGAVETRALASTRPFWRAGFGLPVPPPQPADSSSGDYGSLLKLDGTSIPRAEVPRAAQTVPAIVALRRKEAPSSTFSWRPVLADRPWTTSEIDVLAEAFSDGTKQSGHALAVLADRAAAAGDHTRALALARTALATCDPRGWSRSWDGGGRRQAAAVLARSGGEIGRTEAAKDLAAQASDSDWLASMVLPELAAVATAIDPETDFGQTCPEVRGYLEGMTESLALPDDDPLGPRGSRWWMRWDAPGQVVHTAGLTADTALAELTVRHLAHPAWAVTEGSVRVVARALAARTPGTTAALKRLVAAEHAPDDVVEAAGRAVLGARELGLEGPDGAVLDGILNASPSRVLRDLAAVPRTSRRSLSPLYRLVVPPVADDPLGSDGTFLDPHHAQYDLLAEELDLDVDSVLAAAARYARALLRTYPDGTAVSGALSDTSMRLAYPTPGVWASRAAFGRVLADFDDAGLLAKIPFGRAARLRTVDPKLTAAAPSPRPPQVPAPPPAGHDQRVETWLASLDNRVAEHLAAVTAAGWTLLAGTSRLTVLNWEALQEEATWATAAVPLGDDAPVIRLAGALLADVPAPAPGRLPKAGRALTVLNQGWTLHQLVRRLGLSQARPRDRPRMDARPRRTRAMARRGRQVHHRTALVGRRMVGTVPAGVRRHRSGRPRGRREPGGGHSAPGRPRAAHDDRRGHSPETERP